MQVYFNGNKIRLFMIWYSIKYNKIKIMCEISQKCEIYKNNKMVKTLQLTIRSFRIPDFYPSVRSGGFRSGRRKLIVGRSVARSTSGDAILLVVAVDDVVETHPSGFRSFRSNIAIWNKFRNNFKVSIVTWKLFDHSSVQNLMGRTQTATHSEIFHDRIASEFN